MKTNPISLQLNIAEFLAEFFGDVNGKKIQFSYRTFIDMVNGTFYGNESIWINIFDRGNLKEDSSFYYEYGLLKAEEEEMQEHSFTTFKVTEKQSSAKGGFWLYEINYKPVEWGLTTFLFCTRTRIKAFIQYEDVLDVAAQMQEITSQKPVLCLESSDRLFRSALRGIIELYGKGFLSDPDIQDEHFPIGDYFKMWEYMNGTNLGYATDRAWNWFRTGYMADVIGRRTNFNEVLLNW